MAWLMAVCILLGMLTGCVSDESDRTREHRLSRERDREATRSLLQESRTSVREDLRDLGVGSR